MESTSIFEFFIGRHQVAVVMEHPNRVLEKVPEPMVSCRVSTYNHGEFIADCLEGILMQKTTFPFEIVIGEDESNDQTREICIDFAKRYPEKIRLFLHSQENNIKVEGMKTPIFQSTYTRYQCRGKYHTLCEGDDYWTDPLKLQKQVDFLENNQEFLYSFHYCHKQEGDKITGTRPKSGKGKITLSNLLFRKSYPTMSLLYKFSRDLYDRSIELQPPFITGDFLLLMLLASQGPGYLFPDNMGVYRVHAGGVYSQLSEIKKLQIGIHNRRAALQHIPMNFKQRMTCRLMIGLRQLKIVLLKIGLKL